MKFTDTLIDRSGYPTKVEIDWDRKWPLMGFTGTDGKYFTLDCTDATVVESRNGGHIVQL